MDASLAVLAFVPPLAKGGRSPSGVRRSWPVAAEVDRAVPDARDGRKGEGVEGAAQPARRAEHADALAPHAFAVAHHPLADLQGGQAGAELLLVQLWALEVRLRRLAEAGA